jgi:hypothetical protein
MLPVVRPLIGSVLASVFTTMTLMKAIVFAAAAVIDGCCLFIRDLLAVLQHAETSQYAFQVIQALRMRIDRILCVDSSFDFLSFFDFLVSSIHLSIPVGKAKLQNVKLQNAPGSLMNVSHLLDHGIRSAVQSRYTKIKPLFFLRMQSAGFPHADSLTAEDGRYLQGKTAETRKKTVN